MTSLVQVGACNLLYHTVQSGDVGFRTRTPKPDNDRFYKADRSLSPTENGTMEWGVRYSMLSPPLFLAELAYLLVDVSNAYPAQELTCA